MGKLYTRPGIEATKECSSCGTVWRDSWLDRSVPIGVCPFCFIGWYPDETIKLEKIIKKDVDKNQELVLYIIEGDNLNEFNQRL
jgi:hypothetical protein